MEEYKNLKELTTKISNNLYNTINLLDILEEIVEGRRKEDFLISSMKKQVREAFDNIESCRQLISNAD